MDRLKPQLKTPPLLLFFPLLLLVLFDGTAGQQQQLNSSIERRALLDLRSSLGLRSVDWPIKLDPCSNWRGVSCVNGTVVGINISGFRRTRVGSQNPQFAVDSLVNLTSLESFNASSFALPGQIPNLFGQSLANLRVLDLSFCQVVGGIPFNLDNLTQLGNLNLSHNSISGQIPFTLGQQLLNLTVLDLSGNTLNGSIPGQLGNLSSLVDLDLSGNSLSGSIPPDIGTLSNLQKLNFSGNKLQGPVPPQLGDLSGLVDLDLSNNSLSNSLPLDLNGMKSLQRLLIRNNSLSGELSAELFDGLNRLESLDLSLNNFSGAIPNPLWSLRFVDASGNNFMGFLPTSVATVKAIGAQFNLSNNNYYGGLTSVIERFVFIDLSRNYLEGPVPGFAKSNGSITLNCLQNVTGQRTLQECSSFYASKGLTFDNFGKPNPIDPTPAPATATESKSHKRTIILVAVFGALGLLLILLLLGFLFICTRRRNVGVTRERGIEEVPIPTATSPPSPEVAINFASLGEAFTYQVLLQATGDFSDANLIKHGHSGDLFRGLLEGGIPVVVKRANLTIVKREAYMLELAFLSKVSHTRLVPLLGHCLENENEKYIVYKYMPNGDLSSSLYRKLNVDDNGLQSLDWITRLKIAIGTAEGLCYLHNECTPPFVHRDVQASSILLDDKFEVRLGSLSQICAQEMDAHQSVISRFLRIQQNSDQLSSGSQTSMCAYDVYCFGKVLLELVTGKMGISASNESSVKEWLEQTMQYIHIYDKELINKIVDPSLIVDEDLLEEVWAMAIVARSCLNPNASRRPLMKYILKALENPLRVVREENMGSARLRNSSSSRSSWNAGVFGSWRQSTSDAPAGPASRAGSMKRSGTSGSQGSSGANNGGGDESLVSQKRQQSREIFPEPLAEDDIERDKMENKV